MDFRDSSQEAAFRQEVRDFIKGELPSELARRESDWGPRAGGAGAELASLRTRAVRDGDDYLITGQKIWASGAHAADCMILLARTDPDAPKHKGISYFLLDMTSPGISIRPLVNMLDSHEFNEVFLDNVRVPRRNLLGEENRGWYVAAATLDFERAGVAQAVRHQLIVDPLLKLAREHRICGQGRVGGNPH